MSRPSIRVQKRNPEKLPEPNKSSIHERKHDTYAWENVRHSGPVLCVGKHERRLAEEQPDAPPFNITGRYQSEDGTVTLNLNQAGTHIEGIIRFVLTGEDQCNGISGPQFGYVTGDLTDGGFTLHALDDDSASARITVVDRETLQLESPDRKLGGQFVLNRPEPTLLHTALETLPRDHELVTAYERTPLTRQQIAYLKQSLEESGFFPALQNILASGASTNSWDDAGRRMQLKKIEGILRDNVLSYGCDNRQAPGFWHPSDVLLAAFYLQRILASIRIEGYGASRSALEALRHVTSRVVSEKLTRNKEVALLLALLDLKSNPDEPQRQVQRYSFTLDMAGITGRLGIGIGGQMGILTIEKTTPPYWEPRKVGFPIALFGISAGPSIGLKWDPGHNKGDVPKVRFEPVGNKEAPSGSGGRSSGVAETYDEWEPGDFPGWFDSISFTYGAAAGVGVSFGPEAWLIKGRGVHGTLTANMTTEDPYHVAKKMIEEGPRGDNMPNVGISLGANIGAQLGFGWGYIFQPGTKMSEINVTEKKFSHDYEHDVVDAGSVHFCLGSALLTPQGRQALRVLCACELTALMCAGSQLTIVGHTDRVDTESRNQELSELRALNTTQAIQDILGDSLRIPGHQIAISGYGETQAKQHKRKDGIPNAPDRRVDIILNSRLVLTLRGE